MIKRNLPLMITLAVFVLGYLYCLTQFPGFASTRVICNILTDNAFLGIIAVGMTFVILSGGIDLSVGSVIAFTGVFLAKAIGFWGISPLVAFPLVLVMGCAFGAFMGLLIDALKIPAFIITLAGMFFLRGVSYLVSEESIPINHPVYDTLSGLAWTIPGGGRLSAMGLLMLLVVVAGIFVAHRTRFGNGVCHRRQRHVGESDGDLDSQRHDPYLYALHRTGDTGRDCLFHLYPGGLCAGGRRRRAGCDCLGGDRRYAAKRWRRYRAGNAVRGGDPGADSDLHQLRRHPQLMVDENRHRHFAVYLYRAAAWSDRAVGKSAECGGDAGERGGESLRNAPPAGAGGAGRALRRPGTL